MRARVTNPHKTTEDSLPSTVKDRTTVCTTHSLSVGDSSHASDTAQLRAFAISVASRPVEHASERRLLRRPDCRTSVAAFG